MAIFYIWCCMAKRTVKIMQLYINKKEIEAIRNAKKEIQNKLEMCDDDAVGYLKNILKRLNTLDSKYKKK